MTFSPNTDPLEKAANTISSYNNKVFVSIDFEAHERVRKNFKSGKDTEVGIAILDLAQLSNPGEKLEIQTVNIVTGSQRRRNKVQNTLSWGKICRVAPSRVAMREQIITEIGSHVKGREVVLIGHGFENDWAALESLQLHRRFKNGFQDTQEIYWGVFGGRLAKLEHILDKLRIPRNNLHNGANDAQFILQAFILLALESGKSTDVLTYAQVHALRALAQQPLPEHAKTSWMLERDERIKAQEEKERQQQKEMALLLKFAIADWPTLPPSPEAFSSSSTSSCATHVSAQTFLDQAPYGIPTIQPLT